MRVSVASLASSSVALSQRKLIHHGGTETLRSFKMKF